MSPTRGSDEETPARLTRTRMGRIHDLEYELEVVKNDQKLRELEYQAAQLRDTQRIKRIEDEIQILKNPEEVRDLEAEIQEAENEPASVLAEIIQKSYAEAEEFHDTSRPTQCNQEENSIAVNTNVPAGARDLISATEASGINTVSSHKQGGNIENTEPLANTTNTIIKEVDHYQGSFPAQASLNVNQFIPPISDVLQASAGTDFDLSTLELQYYRDLDFPQESIELSFRDMDLDQLREVASDLQENLESELEPPSETDIQTLCLISSVCYFIFLRTSTVDNIDSAIKYAEKAVECIHINNPKYVPCLKNLITMLMIKYKCTMSFADLERTVTRAEEMLTLAHPDRRHQIMDLLKMRHIQRLLTGSMDQIEELMMMLDVIAISPTSATHHFKRFEETDDINDLQMAIQASEKDVAETHDLLQKGIFLGELAKFLEIKFDRIGELDDLNAVIKVREEALAILPESDNDTVASIRESLLKNLTTLLKMRFYRTGDIGDLEMAITLGEMALAAADTSHSDNNLMLSHLALCYNDRYKWSGSYDDLCVAIKSIAEALATKPENDQIRRALLSKLFHCLNDRFLQTGNIDDLEAVINAGKEAATAIDDLSEKAVISNNLASCLKKRFDRTGSLKDLHMGIKASREALAILVDDNPQRITALSNSITFFEARYVLIGDLDDLQTAIKIGGEVLAGTPHNDPDRISRVGNQIGLLLSRFRRTGNLDDSNTAINMGKEVMATIPNNALPASPSFVNNLVGCLGDRFLMTDDMNDIIMAIKIGQQSLEEIAAEDHLKRSPILMNLGRHFSYKFDRTNNVNDLNLAIEFTQRALSETASDYRNKAVPSDSEKAISLLKEAAESPHSPTNIRIVAARTAVIRLISEGMLSEASQMAELGIKLLPLVAPRQLNQRDQQHMIAESAGLASIAASLALEFGKDAYQAVQLLELGRGVITSLRLGFRTGLSELRSKHPEVAENFERLRDILDSQATRMADVPVSLAARIVQDNANLEFEKIIDRIRLLPNFENFLLPPAADKLMVAACQGPVVFINVSTHRCDALIIEAQIIRSVCLPDLSEQDIKKNVNFMRSIHSTHALSSPNAVSQMFRMLEWLWDTVVNPILKELKIFGPPPNDDWPRIWWIPTGQLSLLPLHAAGYHSQEPINGHCRTLVLSGTNETGYCPPPNSTTLDRVVSSYSSSIKALLYSRQNVQTSESHDRPNEALLVSMDRTPGYSDLEYATEEARTLESLLSSQITTVKLERPCKKAILDRLSSCSIFHFAGHGESDSFDPSKSSLLVSDWQENPLTVEHLIKLNFKSPLLAYLSACSTSNNSAEKLQDEAIHLVTACQLAGFQHVVGSLWEVSDKHCVTAAEEMYKTIVEGGFIDGNKISFGVHKATRRLRGITNGADKDRSLGPTTPEGHADKESGERGLRTVRPHGYQPKNIKNELGDPFIWAAYVHVGP
ncbi:hypothetical protein TWF788_008203 [Orbilia oligospora]|uniref:CHAT domain-containing protein n=1 Tax=Orbilia oligospora TaxID=2813651 RepID=A0A7C8U663_ORBOL|nr:hypothetical protein TWF788_008203 [Orbilia oligospora]